METCKYCGKELKNKHALKAHEFRCKSNPDYEENKQRYAEVTKKFKELSRQKPSAYFNYTSKCLKCGKEFTQRTTQSIINSNKHQRCCCLKCAHSRVHSDETKQKISNSLNKFYESIGSSRRSNNPKHRRNCSKNYIKNKTNRTKDIRKHSCVYCNKEIYAKYVKGVYCYDCAELHKLPNLQLYNEYGKTIPSKQKIDSRRKVQQKLLAEGRHKGWQSRKIISYPEQFWMKVLNNNNIKYSFNHVVNKKKNLGLNDISNYFLDFLIGEKLDLEIDGKQHKYPNRAASDKIRDDILSRNGYIVYRIEWNTINSEEGKQLMKEKIDKFLDFYNNLLKTKTLNII